MNSLASKVILKNIKRNYRFSNKYQRRRSFKPTRTYSKEIILVVPPPKKCKAPFDVEEIKISNKKKNKKPKSKRKSKRKSKKKPKTPNENFYSDLTNGLIPKLD